MRTHRRDFLLGNLMGVAAAARVAAQDTGSNPIYKAKTFNVITPVTVQGRDGRLVNGLEAKDFTLLDNGIGQEIEVDVSDAPISMVLAVEANSAVEPFLPAIGKLGALLEASVIGEQGECAVIAFDHRRRVLTDGFVSDSAEVKRALARIKPGSSTSTMIDTVYDAARLLHNRPSQRRRILLLVAESQDKGSEGRQREALLSAEIHNITIYSININRALTKLAAKMEAPRQSAIPPGGRVLPPGAALTPGNIEQFTNYNGRTNTLVPVMQELYTQAKGFLNPNPLEVLTQQTGGREYSFLSQRDLEAAVCRMGEDVHSQYWISYSPNAEVTPQGGWHEIKVVVARGYRTRSRPGYWMAARTR